MLIKTNGILLGLALCGASVLNGSAQATPTVLTIHADQTASKVSPTLYGLMTEEINHSYEGGLYAEMVSNNTFHGDWSGILDWYLLENGNASAKISIDKSTGPSEALKSSLRIDVAAASESGSAGVLNTGYWGMGLHPNTTYHGSFYAKEDSEEVGPVTVRLVGNESGRVLASATVSGFSSDWAQHTFTLKTGAIEPSLSNHLEITVAHPGTLWLNLVTLFPPTYHDRPNGNRVDLMEKLAGMHPAFLRFPGGNYLEGNHLADWYDWKKTIGPLVDRPGHPSPWGYWSTDQFGFLEFLEWCEDLHMNPLLAVYAGYALEHEHIAPGPDLEPFVQSALDEIEYVTGSTDTKWGAERAKDGHPEPFHLTYVEIGNEDWFDTSGSYDGRFAQFYKAIKAKYPGLQLVATAPTVKSVQPDVLDDHYYLRATQFFADTAHYDKTDRSGPKIFVGEWATREGTPTPNFGAALGDAAWMTGLERNSDVIVMASYAPLLTNVSRSAGAMQWDTDLIGYDALHSYASPSYYAQAMFSKYLGQETPKSELEGAGSRFFYSVTKDAEKRQLYVKLVNATSDARTIDIKVDGATLGVQSRQVVLSAKNTQATNTLEQPANIVPVESALATAGATLHHRMPPFSIEVLILNTK